MISTQTGLLSSRQQLADKVYFISLIVLVVGMPLSLFLISISQFGLVASFLIGGNYAIKAKHFFTNKVCLSLVAVYAMHILGLLYTSDYNYALNDLRIKAPLLLLPFLIFTASPLSTKQFYTVLKFFVLACFAGTVVSTYIWLGFSNKIITDTREISVFISHIRFSLLIGISIFICVYFSFNSEQSIFFKSCFVLLIVWFIFFLFILESMTGLIVGVVATFVYIMQYLIFTKKYILVGCVLLSVLIITGFAIDYFNQEIKKLNATELIDLTSLPKATAKGNLYQHELFNADIENGHHIFLYVAYDELGAAWNNRSSINFDSLDRKNQAIKYTLIRYMTSKGLYKDAEGMKAMTASDIQHVENGVGSIVQLTQTGLSGRISNTIWEINNYLQGGNPSGHTLTMRFEFWKASFAVLKENLIFGVGTGDNKTELNTYYENSKTNLSKQWWLRSHNQYFAIAVSFGLVGLMIFLFSLFYPMIKMNMTHDYFYVMFFTMAIVSFLTEDTLESQAGVTFFAFFNSFFLFAKKKH